MRRLMFLASPVTAACWLLPMTAAAAPPEHDEWSASSSASVSTTMALQVWGACGVRSSSTKIIRPFSRAATAGVSPYLSGGTSNLACGTTRWGHRHIVANHLDQWQTRAAEAAENWRDTADYGIAWALKDPDRVRYRPSNQTYCFSRQIDLVDKRTGRVVDRCFPNVVVARVTKNVITACPSNTQCS